METQLNNRPKKKNISRTKLSELDYYMKRHESGFTVPLFFYNMRYPILDNQLRTLIINPN
jgi:hypothetical protein